MANSSHAAPPKVPAAMIAERRAGWHAFMRFIVANCVGTAVLLIVLLLVFRVF